MIWLEEPSKIHIRDKTEPLCCTNYQGDAMMLSNLKPRSNAALVRNLLPDIETALERGASREAVWQSLATEHGLTATFNGFLKALARARSERSDSLTTVPSSPTQETSTAPSAGKAEAKTVVDCAIQKDGEANATQGKTPDRIVTKDTFAQVHNLDFSGLDEKYK